MEKTPRQPLRQQAPARDARQQRLAKALRQNIARRKAQQAARNAGAHKTPANKD